MKIKLLQEYVGIQPGVEIDVSDAVAQELITKKVAGEIETKSAPVQKHDIPAFKSVGETIKAVAEHKLYGKEDVRLKASLGQGEDSTAAGGAILFHPVLQNEIFTAIKAESKIASACSDIRITQPGVNGVILPQINETARSGSGIYGGVVGYAVSEGSAITPSTMAFAQKDISCKKMGLLIYVTKEMLADVDYIEGFIMARMQEAAGWFLDLDILRGSVGCVTTSVVGATATQAITVAGNYPTAAEISTFYNSMLPNSMGKAKWYMGRKQRAALTGLSAAITTTTSGAAPQIPLFQPSYVTGQGDRLLGAPIVEIEQSSTVQKASAFGFHDFSRYAVVRRNEVAVDVNESVQFTTDQVAIRLTMRVGGAPMLASKVTLEDTSIVAAFNTRNEV